MSRRRKRNKDKTVDPLKEMAAAYEPTPTVPAPEWSEPVEIPKPEEMLYAIGNEVRNTPPTEEEIREMQQSEAIEMMDSASANLDTSIEATKHDVHYTKPPVIEYPADAEHEDWRETGFWGGYHKQGGEHVTDMRAATKAEMEAMEKARQALLEKEKETNVDTHLGQTSTYTGTYDPGLLVREPRASNRAHLDIEDANLPFFGTDLWNMYEISCLTKTGVPVVGIGQLAYPCSSRYIVESKSLKLYLNSFNMTKLGKDTLSALKIMGSTIKADLSQLVEAPVQLSLKQATDPFCHYKSTGCLNQRTVFTDGVKSMPGDKFKTLETVVDISTVNITDYQESPGILNPGAPVGATEYKFHSSLLKSNCKVTGQPDWGDVFIWMKTNFAVSPEDLLKYIVSFRGENHFHEEICETIYKRLKDTYDPQKLGVSCFYTRRGGIDINPTRVSNEMYIGATFLNEGLNNDSYHLKFARQ